jgi:AcrR family transcriptional regulator
MPAGTTLDEDAILAATEDVLRRYGPSKATVLDVARALGVSHASVYRHFSSKAALREAVIRRWLGRALQELTPVADDTGIAPPERLRAWLTALFEGKRARAGEDPELLATYGVLAAEHRAVATDHVADLNRQLRRGRRRRAGRRVRPAFPLQLPPRRRAAPYPRDDGDPREPARHLLTARHTRRRSTADAAYICPHMRPAQLARGRGAPEPGGAHVMTFSAGSGRVAPRCRGRSWLGRRG